jgi:membrane protease YdiL (CAAX protease family)
MSPERKWLEGLKTVRLELWERDNFRMRDAVLLCLFLVGVEFLSVLPLRVFRVNLIILYDIVFLGIVVLMLRQSGRAERREILKWRKVPAPLFFSLLAMFFGLEIMRQELGNVLRILLPVPEDFFGDPFGDSVFKVFTSYALFPALNEELFFRGIILKRLRRNYPQRKALLASSLLFGLMHLNPWQALTASVSGLFFGWIYLEFRSIWLCMFMHGYTNILVSFVPFPVRRLPEPRTYSVPAVHPLWFDIAGAVLFVLGLYAVRRLSQKSRRDA